MVRSGLWTLGLAGSTPAYPTNFGGTMKAYGIPREENVDYPDKGDHRHYALKTSRAGKSKYGSSKCSYRRSKQKRHIRRLWKKRQRRLDKIMPGDQRVHPRSGTNFDDQAPQGV